MKENKYQVPALMRTKLILDLLSDHEADMPEMIKELGFPKSTIYGLLLTLEEMGFVRRLPNSPKYSLGFRLFELGTLAISKVSIRDQAIPFLQQLSRDERITCHLGALDGNEAVYLLKIDPQDSVLINSWEGKRISLNRSAMGKILLAWQSRAKQEQLINSLDFVQITPKTIADKDEFLNHIADVKNQKWAMDDEEDILGICCLAAPVFTLNGEMRYVLSVSGTVHKITAQRIPALRQSVMKTARDISRALGAPEGILD